MAEHKAPELTFGSTSRASSSASMVMACSNVLARDAAHLSHRLPQVADLRVRYRPAADHGDGRATGAE